VADRTDSANACEHGDGHPARSRFSEGEFERAAMLFRAAGDPARLRMLELLSRGEACVSELAAAGEDAMSTVSQRLRLLRAEGLVRRRRDGRHIYYSLADAHVAELVLNALEHASES
jgi:ArsR family transcriptional regulator, lead/cadmium/zinc/bismuth-responsive transcriptional repressor